MKIAFLHVMKAAGSTVNSYLTKNLLWANNFRVENSWEARESDWSADELSLFTGLDESRIYVHNHVGAWPQSIFECYQQSGWFTFSFYRHPGDQWCSFYYWCTQKMGPKFPSIAHNYELNEFLKLAWSDLDSQNQVSHAFADLRANLDLPAYWRQLSYVALFSNENFRNFLKDYFNDRSWFIQSKNVSENRGYEHYRKIGLVSDQTHRLLINSQRYRDYQSLQDRPHTHNVERFKDTKSNVFFQPARKQRFEPVRYIILFQGRAGSTMLTEYLQKHPWIHAFEEILDTFEQTWPNQRRWLNKFYVKLPRKDRTIRVIGFKAKFSSISRPDKFKEFIEQHQIRVIHLHRSNPVKLAVSVVRARLLRERTGKSNLYEEENQLGALTIPIEEFRGALSRARKYQKLQEYVASIEAPQMEMTYERMLADRNSALKEIYDFLNVRFVKTEVDIKKATPDDLREAVANLDELRAAFPELEEHF